MTLRDIWDLFKAAGAGWMTDYAQSMGAALAYYMIFSIAPLLLIVISIAGLFFGDAAARGEIFGQLQDTLGVPGAMAVQGLLESVNKPAKGVTATIIGLALLVIGATSVFGELQDALDRIWRVPGRPKRQGIWGAVRSRLMSFAMIVGIGFLLMVSLLVSVSLRALQKWWGPSYAAWTTLASLIELAFSFAMSTLVFAMIFKLMPRVKIAWTDVGVGAVVTAVFFSIGKFLIAAYIGESSVSSGFGAAASLIVVLIWVYYSAQILLLGAEFTWAYSHKFGSRKRLVEGERESGPAQAK